ncbi:MAG: exonuclease subunit SbcD [Brevinemataceae bacterium]
MKILCTADWHIGKKLESFSRLEEQEKILKQIIDISIQENVNAILIGGDCFDTQTPSPEMTKLFVQTLAELSRGGECPVLVIAGNHDNPLFLSASEAFASQVGVAISGFPSNIPNLEGSAKNWEISASGNGFIEITFKKLKQTIRFLMSPYANALRLKKDLGIEDPDKKAYEILCQEWEKNISQEPDVCNILLGHFFALPEKKDLYQAELKEDSGERPIAGSMGAVSLGKLPEGIDYVILGHIHKAQELYSSKSKAFYTGSPLIYGESESGQTKSVLILEIGRKNKEYTITLETEHDIKTIHFEDFTNIIEVLEKEKDHYITLIWEGNRYLTGEEKQRLYQSHPRIRRIESLPRIALERKTTEQNENLKNHDPIELFTEYFETRQGIPPNEELISLFQECLNHDSVAPSALTKKQGFLPRKLIIEGFYSYKDRIELDFPVLEEENKHFFGIFGAVGSGKSALIEAMIFALYGQTERLGKMNTKTDQQHFSTIYDMMNLDWPHMLIEFSFEIYNSHNIKEQFLCRIHAVRNKKDRSNFKKTHEFLQISSSGELVPLNHNDGEQLLGITYNDFRKTVILQQRDFMDFLKSTPKDNAETLMRLFQLEKFDLSNAVKELESHIKSKFNSLQESLKQLEEVSDTQILSKEQELEHTENLGTSLSDRLQTLNLEKLKLETLLNKKNEWNSISEKLQDLNSKKTDFENAKARRKINDLIKLEEQISDLIQQIQHIEQMLAELNSKNKQSEILSTQFTLERDRLKQEIETLETTLASVRQQKDSLFKQNPEVQLNSLRHRQDNYSKNNDEINKITLKLKDLQERAQKKDSLLEQGTLLSNQSKKLIGLNIAVNELCDHEPCMLCGSADHPSPYHPVDEKYLKEVSDQIEQTRLEYTQAASAEKEIPAVQNELNQLISRKKEYLGEFDSIDLLNQKIQELSEVCLQSAQKITELDQQEQKLTTQIQTTKPTLDQSISDCSQINEAIARTSEQIKQQTTEKERRQNELNTLYKEKDTEFQRLSVSLEEYHQIKQYPYKESSDIDKFFYDLKSLEEQFDKLTQECNGIAFEDLSAEREKIDFEITTKTTENNRILQHIGALKSEITQLKKEWDKKLNLKKEFDIINIKFSNINLLNNLFKGKRLVQFIGQKYLSLLCQSANKRFLHFTKNQFQFSAPENPDQKVITVIDHLSGGEQRNMTTLSGGQSFQAALALALALSEESGTGHRFFFVDEGFGSLDEDSLVQVLETLRLLTREEHRIVGVISHIPTIQNEVSSCILVSPADNFHGSRISAWESN